MGLSFFTDESDSDSDDSEASDDTIEPAAHFVDVASRPSAIRCDVPPADILQLDIDWPSDSNNSKRTTSGTLLTKAVVDGDIEAFKNIADLYGLSPEPIDIGTGILSTILQEDNPTFLDEYIRRSGYGIPVKLGDDDSSPVDAVNDKNRVYLGLTVHGKKRKDLARRHDPNSQMTDQHSHPLVWQAILVKATSILEYLLGDRCLAAYRFYFSNSATDRAEKLRHMSELDKQLPQLLGWGANSFSESPLTAGVLSNDIAVLKFLFQKVPALMKSSLHDWWDNFPVLLGTSRLMFYSVKFTGYNSLMVAVANKCNIDIIDLLLSKGLSPALIDQPHGYVSSALTEGDL